MIEKFLFLSWIFALIIVGSAFAQQNGKRLKVEAIETSQNPGEKWALIIGINKWDNEGIGQLKYTVNDARVFAQTLATVKNGFPVENVRLLTSDATSKRSFPTRSNILAMLRGWFSLAQPEDTILFYFSGHGMEHRGKTYVLPQDVSLTDLENTSIELNHIKRAMKESPAKKRILMLDACHSGAEKGGELMSKAFEIELAAFQEVEGMVTLASCDLNEQSYEMEDQPHGAFTYFLIEALRGNADRDSDGQLWVSEVNYYVWNKVRRWAAARGLKQTPKKIEATQGEIVFAEVGESGASQISPGLLQNQLPSLTATEPSRLSQTSVLKPGDVFFKEDFSGYNHGDPIDPENSSWGENVHAIKDEDSNKMMLGSFKVGKRTIIQQVAFPNNWSVELEAAGYFMHVLRDSINFVDANQNVVFRVSIVTGRGTIYISLPNTDRFSAGGKTFKVEKRGNLFKVFKDNKFVVSSYQENTPPIVGFWFNAELASKKRGGYTGTRLINKVVGTVLP